MAKSLKIFGDIVLPDDHFDAATVVHNVRDAIRTAEGGISKAIGTEFKFDAEIVAPRQKRKASTASEKDK